MEPHPQFICAVLVHDFSTLIDDIFKHKVLPNCVLAVQLIHTEFPMPGTTTNPLYYHSFLVEIKYQVTL